MILSRVGMLVADTSRTRAYLGALERHNLLPCEIMYLSGVPSQQRFEAVPYFDNLTPARATIERIGLACRVVDCDDVNAPTVVEAVRQSAAEVFVYSGPPGAILGRTLLGSAKRFLHVHTGLLPQFRGSTTIYYSLLLEGLCAASALFLDARIDGGPLLAARTFPAPEDRTTMDYGYDPYIRSLLLVDVLRQHEATGEFRTTPQDDSEGETYYIMHPVLRHIAILSRRVPAAARRADGSGKR